MPIRLTSIHICVPLPGEKERFEKALIKLDWYFLRHGNKHNVRTDGERQEAIPRHREINEILAKAIMRRAKK